MELEPSTTYRAPTERRFQNTAFVWPKVQVKLTLSRNFHRGNNDRLFDYESGFGTEALLDDATGYEVAS